MAYVEKYVNQSGTGLMNGSSVDNAWSVEQMLSNQSAGQLVNILEDVIFPTDPAWSNNGTGSSPMFLVGNDYCKISNINTLTLPSFMLVESVEFLAGGVTIRCCGHSTIIKDENNFIKISAGSQSYIEQLNLALNLFGQSAHGLFSNIVEYMIYFNGVN